MGKAARLRPARLGEKLLGIREALGLSQNGLIKRLALPASISREHISAFELGKREPPLGVLLRYARAAGVTIDILVDDELDLPKVLRGASSTRRGKDL
jgi:transcriptional regulator with XRE-family HTH domain